MVFPIATRINILKSKGPLLRYIEATRLCHRCNFLKHPVPHTHSFVPGKRHFFASLKRFVKGSEEEFLSSSASSNSSEVGIPENQHTSVNPQQQAPPADDAKLATPRGSQNDFGESHETVTKPNDSPQKVDVTSNTAHSDSKTQSSSSRATHKSQQPHGRQRKHEAANSHGQTKSKTNSNQSEEKPRYGTTEEVYYKFLYSIQSAQSPTELIALTRTAWQNPDPIFSSRYESLYRIVQLITSGICDEVQIFAFKSHPKLESLFEKIANIEEKSLFALGCSDLADLAWTFARVGMRPPQFAKVLQLNIERLIPAFSMRELSDIFYAVTELRIPCRDLEKRVMDCIVKEPEDCNITTLSPETLVQLAYTAAMSYHKKKDRLRASLKLINQINRLGLRFSYSPEQKLQILRFNTGALREFWHLKKHIDANLCRLCVDSYKRGEFEMFPPPFIDPFIRKTLPTSNLTTGTEVHGQGIEGWYMPQFIHSSNCSVEYGSPSMYTHLDPIPRLLGQYIYRHRVLEAYGFNLLHMSFHEWEALGTEERRYDFITKRIGSFKAEFWAYDKDTRPGRSGMFGMMAPRLSKKYEPANYGKVAWTLEELHRINEEEGGYTGVGMEI